MKKHLNYWLALALLLPALNACQDDNTMPGEEPGTAGTPTVVSASIGDEPDTRAQVTYGTKDPKEGEYFMWNADDQFKAYNITTAEATPTAYTFDISNYNEAQPGNKADFSCANGFPATEGNKIAALYGHFEFTEVFNKNGMKGIKFTILHTNKTTQIQTDNPGNADLKHLKDKIPMWATATAEGNGKLSQVSFHHLSALLRVTLRNAGDAALQVEKVEIYFPDANISRKILLELLENNTKTETSASSGAYATLYLNNKNGNQYATIASGGGSYDCFLPVLAKDDEHNSGTSSLTIKVKLKDDPTVKSVDIAGLNNFKIKAGMRYWFDLTVKADGTLVQTFKTDYAWYTQDNNATAFSLSTPGELRALANLVNGTDEALSAAGVSGAVNFQGKTIRLAGDIDLGNEAWTPIGNDQKPFKGTFNGGGHHISGLNVDNGSNDNAGLFGGVGGKVSNLRVSGKVTTTGNYVGGIAGTLVGGSTVENCIFNGNISGAISVGGIVGSNNGGTIAGCYTKGNVTATNGVAGGIAGNNYSTITACYSEATVMGSGGGIAGMSGPGNSISHCYATGSVSGIWNIGGIIGRHSEGTVENCIALNPALTRTARNATEFGRIAGKFDTQNYPYLTSCSAFEGMTIKDAGGTDIYADATGKHGDALTAAQCLTAATYTGLGFTAADAATTTGWAFDSGATWTYLPWNKAFESFPGIQPADYRIAVPRHITDALAN